MRLPNWEDEGDGKWNEETQGRDAANTIRKTRAVRVAPSSDSRKEKIEGKVVKKRIAYQKG